MALIAALPGVVVRRISVPPYDNNVYLLTTRRPSLAATYLAIRPPGRLTPPAPVAGNDPRT
jgi:hypothetical protein